MLSLNFLLYTMAKRVQKSRGQMAGAGCEAVGQSLLRLMGVLPISVK